MAKLIVGVTDYVRPPFSLEAKALGADVEFVDLASETEAGLDAGDLARCDALLVWHTPITALTIRHLTRCRIVVRYGVGYDAIDVAALTAAGIAFCNTPDYGTEEVADTAVAMLLALQRRIVEYDLACRSFDRGWQEHTIAATDRTGTRSVGLVGVGRIGTAVALRLKPFGYTIWGYDPYQPSGHEKAVGYRRASSLDELLERADAVSMHVPLGPLTRGLVDAGFIGRMRDESIFVNTARGGIVDGLDPILQGLREGRLAGVGLDVLPDEPPQAHPLLDAWRAAEPWLRGRLIINPHTAYYSRQAWDEMRYKAAETAALYFQTGQRRNEIRHA